MGSGASTSFAEALKREETIDLNNKDQALAEVKLLRSKITAMNSFILQEKERLIELAKRTTQGKVRIVYERYTDCFDLIDGKMNINVVDEEYCLSDVMPGCTLELLEITPQERIQQEIQGIPVPFISKDEALNWECLYTYDDAPKSYYVVAFQDAALLAADREATKKRMEAMAGEDDGSGVCTCTNGKACSTANKDHCKDWNNRFTVATKYKAWLSSSIAPSG